MRRPDHEIATSVTAVSSEGGVAVSYTPTKEGISAYSAFLLIVSALIFSTGGLFVRSLDDPHPWNTVFWRSVSACASLLILIIWRERRNTVSAIVGMGKPGWAVAAAFCASSIGMVVALSRTSVAIVLVIFALSPLAAAILAWILIGERVRNYTWIAIAVTVGGVGYMVSGGGAGGSAAGAAIAFIIPLSFGFGTVMIRRHAEVQMAPAMLLAAVISALIALPFASPLQVSHHDLILLLTFGFAQLGVGLAIFSVGAARAPATDVALLSMLEPIMGPIWVWIFMNEYPGVPALIGGSIVFVALAVHTVYAASSGPSANPVASDESPGMAMTRSLASSSEPGAHVVQGLWIGDHLAAMQRCSIQSFLDAGHPYHLYVYGPVAGVPTGARVLDANAIVPANRIWTYHEYDSPAGFSNQFRYHLLEQRGGTWADLDVICLRALPDADYLIAAQAFDDAPVATCLLRAPQHSEFLRRACAEADAVDPDTATWGDTGPALLSRLVQEFGLELLAPEAVCPIDFDKWDMTLSDDPLVQAQVRRQISSSLAVHLWHEMWRRAGVDLDQVVDPNCLYSELLARFRIQPDADQRAQTMQSSSNGLAINGFEGSTRTVRP